MLPRLVFHLYDDNHGIRQACRVVFLSFVVSIELSQRVFNLMLLNLQSTLKQVAPLFETEGFSMPFNVQNFNSDHR